MGAAPFRHRRRFWSVGWRFDERPGDPYGKAVDYETASAACGTGLFGGADVRLERMRRINEGDMRRPV